MLDCESRRLVVVPSDPLSAYEAAGYDWLERYYNPQGFFTKVFAASPLEEGDREAHGMSIRRVRECEFRDFLTEARPDVVRAYGGYWPADLVTRQRIPEVPVIVSVHDRNPNMIHPSLRRANLVLCVSNIVRDQVRRLGVRPSRTRILPNRVDRSIFRPIENPEDACSQLAAFPIGKYILHVGRRYSQKNLDSVIKSLALLPDEYRLVSVGRGSRKDYEQIAKQLGVNDRIHWIDAIKNAELPYWYSWCDCMCTPSRSEGFGIVFIEAAACGAAIVTSDLAPMNEYLRHDESASLVRDFEDPSSIARAIRRCSEDAEYRRQISDAAIEVAMRFEVSKIDRQEVEYYQDVIEGGLGQQLRLSERLQDESLVCLEALGTVLCSAKKRIVRRARRSLPTAALRRLKSLSHSE